MRIRLTRKFANAIDGVRIADYEVGDVIDLAPREARLLLAEDWAVLVNHQGREIRESTTPMQMAEAADSTRRNPINHLRRASRRMEWQQFELPYGRRREDVLLDELRDSRARTISGADD